MASEGKIIYLIRHGEVSDEYRGRYLGATDVPLSATGHRQATAIGEYLKTRGIGKVFSSPLQRAIQTAQEALPECNDIINLAELREINFGRWEKLTFAEISAADPELTTEWAKDLDTFIFPEGEGLAVFGARVEHAAKILRENEAEATAVFTHGGVINRLICIFLGLPAAKAFSFRTERGSISTIKVFSDGGAVLNGLNYTP